MTKRIKIDDLISPLAMEAFIDKYTEDEKYTGDVKSILDKFGRKLISAYENRLRIQSRNIAEEVDEWIDSSPGVFYSSQVEKFLHLSSLVEKKNVSQILTRRCKEGKIERSGTRRGCWKTIDKEIELIEWWKAPLEDIKLKWVFGLEDLVEIYPGNIIVVAGLYNAGKSAMVFDFIKRNVDKFEIDVFNSEAGGSELRKRITKMDIPNRNKKKWLPPTEGGNLNIWERAGSFEDVIKPNGINVIDFLEEHEEFYKMGAYIKRIHDKLDGGVALVMIQKDVGREFGRGGIGTLEKPRLYLALDHGIIKIVKAKNWKGNDNPNGLITHFKLRNGWEFSDAHWHEPNPEMCQECEKVERKRKRNSNKWR